MLHARGLTITKKRAQEKWAQEKRTQVKNWEKRAHFRKRQIYCKSIVFVYIYIYISISVMTELPSIVFIIVIL